MSSRTLVYKGMVTTLQLEPFFPDLSDGRMESELALVHSRFSTNTFPSWDLAHPFRMICHNGEINTLRGNVNWIRARQGAISSPILGRDLEQMLELSDLAPDDWRPPVEGIFVDEGASKALISSINDLALSVALTELLDIVHRHHVFLPPGVSLLLRTLVELEGTAQLLAPSFSLAEVMEPFYERSIQRRLSFGRLAHRAQRTFRDWDRLLRTLPPMVICPFAEREPLAGPSPPRRAAPNAWRTGSGGPPAGHVVNNPDSADLPSRLGPRELFGQPVAVVHGHAEVGAARPRRYDVEEQAAIARDRLRLRAVGGGDGGEEADGDKHPDDDPLGAKVFAKRVLEDIGGGHSFTR